MNSVSFSVMHYLLQFCQGERKTRTQLTSTTIRDTTRIKQNNNGLKKKQKQYFYDCGITASRIILYLVRVLYVNTKAKFLKEKKPVINTK